MPDCTEYDLIIKDLQKNRQHFSFISHVDAWWTMKTILDWAVRWWESWPDQKFWSAVMKLKQSQNTCTHTHELVRLFWMEFLKRQNCLRLVFVSHHGILIDFFFVWCEQINCYFIFVRSDSTSMPVPSAWPSSRSGPNCALLIAAHSLLRHHQALYRCVQLESWWRSPCHRMKVGLLQQTAMRHV